MPTHYTSKSKNKPITYRKKVLADIEKRKKEREKEE